MSDLNPDKAAPFGRPVQLLAIAGLGALVTASGCTSHTSTSAPSSPPTYVTLVLRIQQVGPTGTTPSQTKHVAGAADCRVFDPQAPVPAGVTYLVRLEVGTAHLTSAVTALRALHDVFDVRTEPEVSFSATPTDAGPETSTRC